jgi:hypothetical protein
MKRRSSFNTTSALSYSRRHQHLSVAPQHNVFARALVREFLACGAASDMPSAFAAMQGRAHRAASAARSGAQRHIVPVIVFHGDRDTTVNPRNADAVVTQSAGVTALTRHMEDGRIPAAPPSAGSCTPLRRAEGDRAMGGAWRWSRVVRWQSSRTPTPIRVGLFLSRAPAPAEAPDLKAADLAGSRSSRTPRRARRIRLASLRKASFWRSHTGIVMSFTIFANLLGSHNPVVERMMP